MNGTSAGMGSIPDDGGTTFRVWAPHAKSVCVVGSFNDWSEEAGRLELEGDGYWGGYLDGAAPGDEYKFIIEATEKLFRVDPYALQVTSSVGNAIIHRRDGYEWLVPDNYRTPAWNEMVIYELHLGTFTAPNDGQAGFGSAIERLGHLQELGVNVVELMPPMEFPGARSWGYNPAHLFAIETNYGGPDAFKAFIRAAHEAGIAIIMDVVYNHLGPGDLDLWQFDGWSENGGGGIYFYNDWRSETPWGHTRPDYGRAEVRTFLRDNALTWLEDYRVDGLRWDATSYIANVSGGSDSSSNLADGWSLMQWINDEINSRQPWKVSIAEDLRGDQAITEPTSNGGAGFDSQWDSRFVHPVRAALIEREDANRSMSSVAGAITHQYGPDAFRRVVYTESHDEVANGKARLPEEIWPGQADGWHARKRSALGAALVFTVPGVPMIFQGQELLEDQWFRDDDPIDWTRLDTQSGVARMYRDLIELRRNLHGVSRGLTGQHVDVHHVNEEEKIIGYHRWDRGGPNDEVIVVANFSDQRFDSYEIGVPYAGRWRVVFDGDAPVYHESFEGSGQQQLDATEEERDGMGATAQVGLAPYSAIILSRTAQEG